jgi:hypothetical protein
MGMTPDERFDAKVIYGPGQCWTWSGARGGRGQYGKFTPTKGNQDFAHRYAWERVNGPIPAGLVIDHLCRNPLCVRVEHLEVVTYSENSLRGNNPAVTRARHAQKTHCPHGHEYTEENTWRNPKAPNERDCRACARIRRARRREAAA